MNQYNLAWRYMKECRIYFLLVCILFFSAIVVGLIFPVFFSSQIEKLMRDLLEKTSGYGFGKLFLFIFENNVRTSFVGFIGGLIFGSVPIAYSIVNGYVIGFVAGKAASLAGIAVLWKLIPHGILEIPAIIISLVIGVKLGFSLIGNFFIKSKKKIKLFWLIILFIICPLVFFIVAFIFTLIQKNLLDKFMFNLVNSVRVFLLVVLPLLLVAALIETFGIIFLK